MDYNEKVAELEARFNQVEQCRKRIDALVVKLGEMNSELAVMLEAQQILTTVSNDNTEAVLSYITGIINKTLGEIFPHDTRRIYLEKTMYQGQHAHINLRLVGTNGVVRDIQLQAGTGLRQVISFLFVLSLIEVRKGRPFLISDELLNGLHPKAKRIVMEIIKIFAEEGFQFVMVEYGVDDLGKIYIVEKPDDTAIVSPLNKDCYENEVFVFTRPKEDVDMSILVDESEGEVDG